MARSPESSRIGGFGVLRSSVLAPDLYAAGASFCGVADLKRLHEKTLKVSPMLPLSGSAERRHTVSTVLHSTPRRRIPGGHTRHLQRAISSVQCGQDHNAAIGTRHVVAYSTSVADHLCSSWYMGSSTLKFRSNRPRRLPMRYATGADELTSLCLRMRPTGSTKRRMSRRRIKLSSTCMKRFLALPPRAADAVAAWRVLRMQALRSTPRA